MQKLLVCCAAAVALAAGADRSPNLSGKWTLDKDKSEFARGGPDSMTATITDDGKKIRLVQTVGGPDGERTTELVMERDAESVNRMGDSEMRTRLRQDGARLLEETTFSRPGGDLTRKGVITLSEDGKTLTMEADYESSSGGFHEKIVLQRNSPAGS